MHKFTWVARGAAARHVLNDGPYFLSTLNRSWNYYNNNSRAKIMLFLLFWYWCSFRVALHMNQFYMYSVVFEWRFGKFKQTHGKHRSSALFFFFFFLSLLSSAYCEGEVICEVRNKMCRYALIGSSALDGESYFEFICYLWWCRGNNSTASHCFVCGVKAKHSDASRKLGGLNELRWNGSSMLAHIRIS